jgi:hypothetical protein
MAIQEYLPQAEPYIPQFKIVPILELSGSEERQRQLRYMQFLERGAVDYELRIDGEAQGAVDLDINGEKATIDDYDAREKLEADPFLSKLITPLLALSVCEVNPKVRTLIIHDKLASIRFH